LEVYANIRKWSGHVLLAICDADLLGKTLRDKGIVFTVHEDFYKGSKMDADQATKLIKECTIVNMVGHTIVSKAVEKGFVHPEAVLKISGVPHAQIVRM